MKDNRELRTVRILLKKQKKRNPSCELSEDNHEDSIEDN